MEGRVKEVIVDSRINKVLAMHTDSVAMLEALDSISEFYGKDGNTIDARRSLRQDLEFQNIGFAKKFLKEFEEVRFKIETVEQHAKKLESSCELLSSRVANAGINMKSFMEKASEFEFERNRLLTQSQEITSFLGRFQLSNEEIEALHHSPIDESSQTRIFFKSLERLRVAYLDCKVMVEKHRYSAGFELLDLLGQHQDTAYQRLFEWVKSKCDHLTSESMPSEDLDTVLQIAIKYLKDLPVYFAQCQDIIVTSRRTLLVQKFVIALTQGGAVGQSHRAIDMHAHDAVRYIGDMLAWMHQTIASEQEFLEAVFGFSKSNPKDRNNKHIKNQKHFSQVQGDNNSNITQQVLEVNTLTNDPVGLSVEELLVRCLQGLGRPLRVRIMQTLEGRTGLEVLYSLADLLSFYEVTFTQVLPMENAVHSAIKGCLLECKRLFTSSLNRQAESLVQSPSSYPLDLTTSHATKECAKQIQEVLRVFVAALSPLPSQIGDECYVDNVLGCIIQPLLQSYRIGGQALQGLDMAIFMLNNVSIIQRELKEAARRSESVYQATASWIEQLQSEANIWVGIVVTEEVSRILHRSDIDKLLEILEVVSGDVVASHQIGLGVDRVSSILRSFYSSLFSMVTPQFERLIDPDTREIARLHTAEAVAEAYAKVYAIVSTPSHEYDPSILTHSPEEVRVLLGCN